MLGDDVIISRCQQTAFDASKVQLRFTFTIEAVSWSAHKLATAAALASHLFTTGAHLHEHNRVAHNDKQGACAGDGDVEALGVAPEADVHVRLLPGRGRRWQRLAVTQHLGQSKIPYSQCET